MNRKVFILLCFSICFISCNKKNESNNKTNVQTEDVVITNSSNNTIIFSDNTDKIVIKGDNNQINSESSKDNVNITTSELEEQKNMTAFQLKPIKESISKQFIYDFPEIINFNNVHKYTYSTSDFTEEEKLFYEEYVGCYLSERQLSKEILSSYLSEVQINWIENDIIFWGFCKSKRGVRYNLDDKQFYEYAEFDTWPIKKLSDFKLPQYFESNGYKKLTDCQILNEIISEKKAKMNRQPLTEIEEKNVRDLLLQFFNLLSKREFDKIIEDFFVSTNNTDEIKKILNWQVNDLQYQNAPFDIYINVFFNDNIENFEEDTIFVELKYRHPINYVSFAIKEINGQLKILKYIARYDGE